MRFFDQGYNTMASSPNMPMMGYSDMNSIPMYQDAPQDQIYQQQQQPAELDDAAFEEAFAQARAEIEQQEQVEFQNTELGHDDTMAQSGPNDLPMEGLEQIRIGSDTIEYHDGEALGDRADDGDALAKTAGQLLDSVSHDQSQKFRESSFLALMRRIRDREVKVDGDEFRDVSSPPAFSSSPETSTTPHHLPLSVNNLQFCPV